MSPLAMRMTRPSETSVCSTKSNAFSAAASRDTSPSARLASARAPHFAEQVGADVARRRREGVVAERTKCVGVEPQKQGVVVKHLLEVRDEPPLVRRVAMEAAAEVIPDPAGPHAGQGEPDSAF